jgi:hypothetical protein
MFISLLVSNIKKYFKSSFRHIHWVIHEFFVFGFNPFISLVDKYCYLVEYFSKLVEDFFYSINPNVHLNCELKNRIETFKPFYYETTS